MGSTSNPSTDPETYLTTAEPGLFATLLSLNHHHLQLNNQKSKSQALLRLFQQAEADVVVATEGAAEVATCRSAVTGVPAVPAAAPHHPVRTR